MLVNAVTVFAHRSRVGLMQSVVGGKVQAVTNTTQLPLPQKANPAAELRIQVLRRNLAKLAAADIRDEAQRRDKFKRIIKGDNLTNVLNSVQVAPDLRAIGDGLQ